MAKMNPGFLNLKKSYLFIEIGKRVREYIDAHPDNKIIKMGIGDVTQPLAPVVVAAMKKAADEMGVKETFRGYEDSGKGYEFLREAEMPLRKMIIRIEALIFSRTRSLSATVQRATVAT